MRFYSTLSIALCIFLSSLVCYARGPSTEDERKKAVALNTFLETSPLADEAEDARVILYQFIEEVPDIAVRICFPLLDPVLEKSNKYTEVIYLQPLFSQLSYLIQNPENANDDHATSLAGIMGALRTYEALLKTKKAKRVKNGFLDELIVLRDKGRLSQWVESQMGKCSEQL